jgi:murein L,D-transpeptidase YcbB/YkuD
MILRRCLTLAAALAVLSGLPSSASPGLAQDDQSWMNDVFGDRTQSFSRRRKTSTTNSRATDRATAGEVLLSQSTLRTIDRAIQIYDSIVRRGGWAGIPGRGTVRPGDNGRRVEALQRRLLASGDLSSGRSRVANYDAALQEAVTAYQRRIGITPSGTVNHRTLAMLNVPAEQRLRQLQINRTRVGRLLDELRANRYVVVNIPAYELQAVEAGQVALFSRVIVGKPSTPTPEIQAAVKAVNLLPYWHVPQSIAERALIPKIKEDNHYLDREHIRVFSSWGGEEIDPRAVNWWSPQSQRYVFRQDPGPFNALGVLRVDMPNSEIVYMHDTPLKGLFRYALRPYSAGCVRVQKILELAGWLTQPATGIGQAGLADMINAGQRETIDLPQPVPVKFTYVSAWGTRDGTVHFRADIYDKDQEGADIAQSAPWDKADVRVTP